MVVGKNPIAWADWDCLAEQWPRLCTTNRVGEGQQTDNDVIQVKALANTDTATWPDEFVKVCLNNYWAGQNNEDCIDKLDSEAVIFKAQDSTKDTEINTSSISIPDNVGLSQSANLPAKLKLCVGARVVLTDNISVSDRLINSSVGIVKHLDKRSKPLCSTAYVKFYDSKAGNFLKDRRLCGELKECVPITARTKSFHLKTGKSREVVWLMQGDLKSNQWQKDCYCEGLSTTYISGSILHLTFQCQKSW